MRHISLAGWITLGVVLLGAPHRAVAWFGEGHERISRTAVTMLPEDLPGFFRAGGTSIAHNSQDPDVFKIVKNELATTEGPEHFIDLEMLGDTPLPTARFDMLTWCVNNKVPFAKAGLLPYAITEWTERLTVAFAEYRRWPNNVDIQRKILVYAGILSHYAGDTAQPLHVTIHHNGRAGADGKSSATGIHYKVDALIEKLPANLKIRLESKDTVEPFKDLFPAIAAELQASHSLVEQVYELESSLPAQNAPLAADGPVTAFARERLRVASLFAARLFVTAWTDSAAVRLPDWHKRAGIAAAAGATRPSSEATPSQP
jgi:hypothetical protein